MDQLLGRVDTGRTKEPRTKHELIYVKTGAQRGTNHLRWSRLIECYRQVKAVADGRRNAKPVEGEHRAILSSYAAGFLRAASLDQLNEAKNFSRSKGVLRLRTR